MRIKNPVSSGVQRIYGSTSWFDLAHHPEQAKRVEGLTTLSLSKDARGTFIFGLVPVGRSSARSPKADWIRGKGILFILSLLITLYFFQTSALAAAFDFYASDYASDLIAKESYRKISMDFKDANLKTILKIFSEQSGLNFIAAQGVSDRTVTLYMDNVPLQQALNKIISANNLVYELEPGSTIFIVKESGRPAVETITKVYYLKYTRLKSSNLQKVINKGPTIVSAASGGMSGGGSSAAGAAGAVGEGAEAGGIESSVRGMLTKNGKMMIDERTNSLVVTDIATQFEKIDKVIAMLDVPTPQVMIEVEMLDVAKSTVDAMGVDTSLGTHLLQVQGASTQTKFPFFADAVGSSTAATFQYGTLSSSVFQAALDLLTTDDKTKFLARPRILTLSNESAVIKITTNEAIGIQTTTNATQGAATQTVEAERFETGVSLKVTPQVDLTSGFVTMFIEPVVAEVSGRSTFQGQTFNNPEVRSSTATLRVKAGETIVLGGLIRTRDKTTIKKVPFFGDVPLLGAAFRHRDRTNEERELIVFITPHIVGQDNLNALAQGDITASGPIAYREQATVVSRSEAVDDMLEKLEN